MTTLKTTMNNSEYHSTHVYAGNYAKELIHNISVDFFITINSEDYELCISNCCSYSPGESRCLSDEMEVGEQTDRLLVDIWQLNEECDNQSDCDDINEDYDLRLTSNQLFEIRETIKELIIEAEDEKVLILEHLNVNDLRINP